MMTVSSGTVGEETNDEAYNDWVQAMSHYARGTNSCGLTAVGFWIVIRLDAKGFSDALEMHEKIPMMMPRKGAGTLAGIARTAEELDLITKRDPKKYVYLTYKIKLQGQNAWRDLLEFLGEHDMLEEQGN